MLNHHVKVQNELYLKMADHTITPLMSGRYYHIYNRGNGGCDLFYQHRNYLHFLKKYGYYLSDYIDTYAYCLLPNHFHLLIRVKNKQDFLVKDDQFPIEADMERLNSGEIVAELFRRFFMSYSKSINIQESRNGSLFQKNFRRKLIDNENYFVKITYYIHNQLKHHGFDHLDDKDYQWSSYCRFLLEKETKLKKKEVFDWFGGKSEFISFHANHQKILDIAHLTIEEE